MKKGILLFLSLLTLNSVTAKNTTTSTSKIGVNYRYDDVISFFEKGIEYHVFLNGDFDFNTHPRSDRYYDYNGVRFRAGGVRIERDYRGRVRRVGNTFINYDGRGNVKRIGSVFMRYRYGQLIRVGNLKIKYDRWGNPRFYGRVKHRDYYNDDFGIDIDIRLGDVCDYDDVYFYRREFRDNYRQFREDDSFFYYRAVPNANIGRRSKILKRRKPARSSTRRNNRFHKKRSYDKKTPERNSSSRRRG